MNKCLQYIKILRSSPSHPLLLSIHHHHHINNIISSFIFPSLLLLLIIFFSSSTRSDRIIYLPFHATQTQNRTPPIRKFEVKVFKNFKPRLKIPFYLTTNYRNRKRGFCILGKLMIFMRWGFVVKWEM